MKRRIMSAFWSSALCISVLLLCGPALLAHDNSSPTPTVRHAVAFGISAPLRELAKQPTPPRYVLHESRPVHLSQRLPTGPVVDTVEQSAAGGGSNFSIGVNGPGLGLGFSGFETTFNYPDDNIAVGKNQILQVVNNSIAVFDKSLNSLGSASIDVILGQFGGACAAGTPEGHPIAQYDRSADRWLIAENVVTAQPYSGTACIAVSTSSDATGSYYAYQFSLGNGYPDLAKWGIWSTSFFQSNDNFGSDGKTFMGAYECAYDSAKMLVGDMSAEQICFQLSASDFALMPADIDSPAQPPPNEDEFLFSMWNSTNLALYSFHVDWSTVTGNITGEGGSQLFPVAAFTPACNGQYLAACVPQLGTPNQLDVLGDRLLYRLVYYNGVLPKVPPSALPVPFQNWLIVHDVTAAGGNTAERWYEFLAPITSIPVTQIKLYQSGTYAPDNSNYRWMGSIARDKDNNILLGYSESSSTIYPSIAITGRLASDPLGTMEPELSVIGGGGAYSGVFDFNLNRWGDYTSMRLDPVDNCTLWYTNEYYSTTGLMPSSWSTQINSAQITGCSGGK